MTDARHAAEQFVAPGHRREGVEDLRTLRGVPVRKLVGSGLTAANLERYFELADAFIVGSSLRRDGRWTNPPDPERVERMVAAFAALSRPRG